MLTEHDDMRSVESVVRSLATAAKTLRLYPASSPIPVQALEAAAEALSGILTVHPTLALVVAREGFTFRGAPIAVSGGADLASMLTSHGVAEVDLLPGCSASELGTFIEVVLRDSGEVRASHGVAALLAVADTANIVVSEVVLTAVTSVADTAADIDGFLRELGGDEKKLTAWLAAAAAGDPRALSDGLAELARAAGPGGISALQASLGSAFLALDVGGRDTLVGLALEPNDASPILQGMLRTLQPHDLASSLADGLYAKNMLSMSSVLTALPLGATLDAIIDELRPMLVDEGHTDRELAFLGRMLEARTQPGSEPSLADRLADYQTVAALTRVGDAALDSARSEIRTSGRSVNARTVNTLLSLLDQQQDFALWSKTLANLATLVPSLLAEGELDLADKVLSDLGRREARTTHPWPGLAEQMQTAVERATSAEAMAALVTAVLDDPASSGRARDILQDVSPAGQKRFVAAALAERERDGLAAAEDVLGRRLVGLLIALAAEAPWFQVGQIAGRLASESDPHSRDTVVALARRPDERSRQEVARGLGASPAAAAIGTLAELATDSALEVAVTAVHALGRTTSIGAASVLGRVFDRIDSLGKDFPLAREVLGALARTPDEGARDVLERIAGQRALIKRGHFTEVQGLARQALAARAKGGGRS